jgi:hypothetical protein
MALATVGMNFKSSSGVCSLCRIFLKEFLKENYDRLCNIFESLKR